MKSARQIEVEFNAPWRRTTRGRIYEVLERSHVHDVIGRKVDNALIVLIMLNVLAVTMETVESVYLQYRLLFDSFEYFSVLVFSIEYLTRVWSCVDAKPPYKRKSNWYERLSWMLTPSALVDLLAIAPLFLSMLFFIDLRILRVLRLLRILKLTRYSMALNMILDVLRERANAFFAAFFILMIMLVVASSGAYLAEHRAQPEDFGSIPHAMWWAVATLTTVGYGDVTPVTVMGKLFGALVTIIGIGMAALPAGILASGFADHLAKTREELKKDYKQALADNNIDAAETEALEKKRIELGISADEAQEIEHNVRSLHKETSRCPHCGKKLWAD